MTQFDVKTKMLKENLDQFLQIISQIETVEGEVQSVNSELNNNGFLDVKRDMETAVKMIEAQKNSMMRMQIGLAACIIKYEWTEGKILVTEFIKKLLNSAASKKTDAADAPAQEDPEQAYLNSMVDQYGFSEEEAALIRDAYDAFMKSEEYAGLDNKEKIGVFFSNMASLIGGYSSDSKLFRMMGGNPSTSDAVDFFNGLGIDGNALKDAVKNQHNNPGDHRDFAHECAMYSVYSHEGKLKFIAGLSDNVNDLVGFKGDIYSKSMGMDDIKSDIAAVNIYNRMLNAKDGNIFAAMSDYNKDKSINPSREFLENFGDGDAQKGLERVKDKIDDTSLGTHYLDGYNGYGECGGQQDDVSKLEEQFLNYLKEESGVK